MTSSSASRPGFDPPSRPAAPDASRPPAEAVSLADLIRDAGPMPPDAALECVQRLAERLTATPAFSCAALGPSDVLIDDDGGVWLRDCHAADSTCVGPEAPEGMDRLGRLLAFLVTGDGRHLDDGAAADAAALPVPLSTVAGRLFSRNGAGYRTYAELARDAATLRGVAPAAPPAVPAGFSPRQSAAAERREVEPAPPMRSGAPFEPARDESRPAAAPEEPSGAKLGVAVAAMLAGGAMIAFVIWQML